MNITIVTGLYPPDIGGPATYTKMLEEYLPKENFTLRIVEFGCVRKYPKIIRHFMFAKQIFSASKSSDIIFALDPVSVGLPALLVARLRRKTFLLRVPGDYAWEQGQLRFGVKDRLHTFIEKRYRYGVRTSLLCWLESFVAKRAKRVIVPSDYMVGVLEKWGVKKEDIQRIHSALIPLSITDSKASLRTSLEYDGYTVVSAGRLVPNKGFPVLVKSFAKFKQINPDATLIIIGDGPEQKNIERIISECGITESVRLVGSLSKDVLGASIAAADLFVLNTAHEGLSHQLLEVMALEVPIVTTDVGGNPELIEHESNGLLISYNNEKELLEAMDRIKASPEIVCTFTKEAKEKTHAFTQEKLTAELITLLRSLHA